MWDFEEKITSLKYFIKPYTKPSKTEALSERRWNFSWQLISIPEQIWIPTSAPFRIWETDFRLTKFLISENLLWINKKRYFRSNIPHAMKKDPRKIYSKLNHYILINLQTAFILPTNRFSHFISVFPSFLSRFFA